MKTVSEYLGNTPAVCRSSYIDPKLFDRFDAGETIAPLLGTLATSLNMNDRKVRESIELAVIDLISDDVCPVNPRRLIGRYRDELPAVTFF